MVLLISSGTASWNWAEDGERAGERPCVLCNCSEEGAYGSRTAGLLQERNHSFDPHEEPLGQDWVERSLERQVGSGSRWFLLHLFDTFQMQHSLSVDFKGDCERWVCFFNADQTLEFRGDSNRDQKKFKNAKNIWDFLNISCGIVHFHLLCRLPYAQYVPKSHICKNMVLVRGKAGSRSFKVCKPTRTPHKHQRMEGQQRRQ